MGKDVSFTWSPEKTIELTPEEERELRKCEAKYEKLWLERQKEPPPIGPMYFLPPEIRKKPAPLTGGAHYG